MHVRLQELAEKRLLVVTGKGGAGKSVLTAALAACFAKLGKKVWLVEIGRKRDRNFSRLFEILGVDALGHGKQDIKMGKRPVFAASVLDPTQSLVEYVDLKLHTAGLAGLLLNNRVTASLLEVVPGLPELVSLGKLWHELVHPAEAPDLVIIDGPASGHCVTLLHSPKNFELLTKQGPLHRDAQAMHEFLTDKEKSAILVASLPEEMSLQESLEHREILRAEFQLPLLFLNKNFPAPAKLGSTSEKRNGEALLRAYAYSEERAAREKEARVFFQKENRDWPCLDIPFFFPEPKSPLLAERIADYLEGT